MPQAAQVVSGVKPTFAGCVGLFDRAHTWAFGLSGVTSVQYNCSSGEKGERIVQSVHAE